MVGSPDLNDAELCERLFHTDDGRPWLLHKLPFYRPIININDGIVLLKTSRQSIKTTCIRSKLVIRSIKRSGNAALYVSPTGSQATTFSRTKLDTIFAYNKALEKLYKSKNLDWNVFFKQFKVGSGVSTATIRTTGGARSAESIRGGTYNDIFKDEYQSYTKDLLPVIDECAATFAGDNPVKAFFFNAGTPLSFQNPIEDEWGRSKGYEWIIKCPHCRKWQEPLSMRNIDPFKPYLFCLHCDKDVRKDLSGHGIVPNGEWVATNPNGKFPGFRVVRLMMPWAEWRNETGTGILDRLETWPERRFINEIMGLPFDAGESPITLSDIKEIATSPNPLPKTGEEIQEIATMYRDYPTYAGLDWAMNATDGTSSYTTFGVSALVNGRLRLIFAYKFMGQGSMDQQVVLQKIIYFMKLFAVNYCVADYGVGYFEDLRLMQEFPQRVAIAHYSGSTTLGKTRYDPISKKFIVPRTASLDQLVVSIKSGVLELPPYDSCKEFVDDWLRMKLEVSDHTSSVMYRSIGKDDFFHVTNYMHLASRMHTANTMQEHNVSEIGYTAPSGF